MYILHLVRLVEQYLLNIFSATNRVAVAPTIGESINLCDHFSASAGDILAKHSLFTTALLIELSINDNFEFKNETINELLEESK